MVPFLPSGGGEGDGGEGDAGGAWGVVDLTIAHIFLEHLKQNNLVFLYKTGIIKSEHIWYNKISKSFQCRKQSISYT